MRNSKGQQAHINRTLRKVRKELPMWFAMVAIVITLSWLFGPWVGQQIDLSFAHEDLVCDGDANCVTLEEWQNGK